MIDGVELPDCDGNLETVLDHVERGERDDLRQAGLAHVDVHSDAVAARKGYFYSLGGTFMPTALVKLL